MKRVLSLVVIVVIANIGLLASMWVNRRGESDASLRMTERELSVFEWSERDSALRLRFDYVTEDPTRRWLMPWLTPEKLAAIGFVCPALAANETVKSCGLSRRAFVALEYEGDAWQKTLAEYRRRRDEIATQPRVGPPPSMVAFYEEQIQFGSRLILIDGSSDPAALRRAHPDRHKTLILPAALDASIFLDREKPGSKPDITGRVSLLTPTIVAPSRARDVLSNAVKSRRGNREPRYTVDVTVGRRHEPWIVSVNAIDSTPPSH